MERPVDELKQKAEFEEYAEDGRSAEVLDFEKKEAKLRRKLDLYIAPVMMLLMLISYLDRGNIGFAATQGMADDIGLHGNQLNVRSHCSKCHHLADDSIKDSSLDLLLYLCTCRTSHLTFRQTPSVSPSHSYHHILLGSCLYVYGIHSEFCRPLRVPNPARMVRRVCLSARDYEVDMLTPSPSCLFPSMTLLLANWYRREELAQRISYLFSKSD